MKADRDPMFDLFHRYYKLVRRGLVKPLRCPQCNETYDYGFGMHDDFVLKCFTCDTTVSPGVDTIGNVRAVVMEHFE